MNPNDSTNFDSFLPIYDVIPDKWEDAQQFFVEVLKKISQAVNTREIGWLLDEELLTGKAFIPGPVVPGNNPDTFRQVLRKVIEFGPIVIGVNSRPHNILFDVQFTLVDLWASATNSVAFQAVTFSNPQNITMDAVNINITSAAAYDRCFAIVEYMQEL